MTRLDLAATLRADRCAVQTVVVCSCGARVADGHPARAWRLAAAHVEIHGRASSSVVKAALKYARKHDRK